MHEEICWHGPFQPLTSLSTYKSWRCWYQTLLKQPSKFTSSAPTMLNRSLPSAYRSANMGVDIFESSFTDKASLEKLNTDEYFHKYAPRTWDFGRFSTFCNELPGFPQINRNPCARFLWDHNLEKLTTCNDSKMRDRAMRLLNVRSTFPGLHLAEAMNPCGVIFSQSELLPQLCMEILHPWISSYPVWCTYTSQVLRFL